MFVGGLRDEGGHQVAGVLPQHAGGLSVLIPVDLTTLRIGSVLGDARHLQRLAVDATDVAAGADDRHGSIAAPLIQIPAGGRAALGQLALVIAPAFDPLVRSLALPHLADLLLKFLNGMYLGGQAGDLLAEISQHHRMHVCIHKAGNHTLPTQIHNGPISGGQIFLRSDPGDHTILDRHSLGITVLVVTGIDLSIDIGEISICVHSAQPPFCYNKHSSKICAKKASKDTAAEKRRQRPCFSKV